MTRSDGLQRLAALVTTVVAGALLTACADEAGADAGVAAATTVTIEDNHGQIEVPVAPARVVALDNTVFQTLSDWDIPVVAVPKAIMGDLWPEYTDDPDVLDVGAHFEPNLEAVVEADADLIIGGYRFASFYEDLKAINPATIEITPRDGQDHATEFARQLTVLGQIFDREAEAQAIVDQLEGAIEAAREAYNGTDPVLGLITSGGTLAYAAPGDGRGVGHLFPTLDLTPAIEREAEDATHGDEISVEAIASADPAWLIVLDRDGAVLPEGYVAASQLIEDAEALQHVTAVQEGQIVYLEPGFYLDEGVQSYTRLYQSVADAFAAAN